MYFATTRAAAPFWSFQGVGVSRGRGKSKSLSPWTALCLLCRRGQSRSPPAGGETIPRDSLKACPLIRHGSAVPPSPRGEGLRAAKGRPCNGAPPGALPGRWGRRPLRAASVLIKNKSHGERQIQSGSGLTVRSWWLGFYFKRGDILWLIPLFYRGRAPFFSSERAADTARRSAAPPAAGQKSR